MSDVMAHVSAQAVAINLAVETAVLTTPAVFSGLPRVLLRGHLNVTQGTGGTNIIVRVRQGNGTGGTVIGLAETDNLGAAALESFPYSFEDSSGLVASAAGAQWTLTVQATGATANGTVNYADMAAEVIF